MRLLDVTFPSAAANLALDEALLLDAGSGESLRLWEAASPIVVLGRSSRVAEEVDELACEAVGAPVLRRVSGGATIVTGPGCLMYAVTLDLGLRPELADVGRAHRFVLDRVAAAARRFDPSVAIAGTSDLVLQRDGLARKFAGSSLRVVRRRLLYHGTLLCAFDLPLVGRLLRTPPRQPEYRAGRHHGDFITNLGADAAALRAALAAEWNAAPGPVEQTTRALADGLVEVRYSQASWNLSR